MTRPSFRPLLAALAAGSILAGCVSGPDFERPDAPSATAYRSPSDPAGTPAPGPAAQAGQGPALRRSEEHTSELQSLMRISYAVFCLKKKKHTTTTLSYIPHLSHSTSSLTHRETPHSLQL